MAKKEATIGQPTIQEYVDEYRDLVVSFDTMHLKELVTFTPDSSGVTEGILLGDSFIQKYRSDLEELITTKVYTKDEVSKYVNNPWALSYDLYGSVEYWFLLLDLNNIYSATEFTSRTVKVYDGSLPDVINTILAAEEAFIDVNNAEIDNLDETDINESDDDSDIDEED